MPSAAPRQSWHRWNGEVIELWEIDPAYPVVSIEVARLLHPKGWPVATYHRGNPFTRDDWTLYPDYVFHGDPLPSDAWNEGHRFPT